jgi:hypothetical protein
VLLRIEQQGAIEGLRTLPGQLARALSRRRVEATIARKAQRDGAERTAAAFERQSRPAGVRSHGRQRREELAALGGAADEHGLAALYGYRHRVRIVDRKARGGVDAAGREAARAHRFELLTTFRHAQERARAGTERR